MQSWGASVNVVTGSTRSSGGHSPSPYVNSIGVVGPASSGTVPADVGAVLAAVVADGVATGAVVPDADPDEGAALHPDIPGRLDLPVGLAARAVLAWTALFGLVGFEVFGHTENVVVDRAGHFARAVDRLADPLGLPPRR